MNRSDGQSPSAGSSPPPLIFLTNDDGIASPGLYALVEAVAERGELLVVAPRHQRSLTGRALGRIGVLRRETVPHDGHQVTAYSVEAPPASAVQAERLLAARRPGTPL